MACILIWSSAVRVHDSQAYRKMDVTSERISRILELREILQSFQTGFNSINAAVACAILESISGLEPSSVITEPRYLKLVTVSNFCAFTVISMLMPRTYVQLTWLLRSEKARRKEKIWNCRIKVRVKRVMCLGMLIAYRSLSLKCRRHVNRPQPV